MQSTFCIYKHHVPRIGTMYKEGHGRGASESDKIVEQQVTLANAESADLGMRLGVGVQIDNFKRREKPIAVARSKGGAARFPTPI